MRSAEAHGGRALAAPAGKVWEQVVDADRDQHHHYADQDRVKAAGGIDRPQDDPDDQPGGGGENQSHAADATGAAGSGARSARGALVQGEGLWYSFSAAANDRTRPATAATGSGSSPAART